MDATQAKKIQEQINAYGLGEALVQRLNLIIVGGVAKSTIYAAFSRNRSPRERLIVETARQMVAEHQAQVETELLATATA